MEPYVCVSDSHMAGFINIFLVHFPIEVNLFTDFIIPCQRIYLHPVYILRHLMRLKGPHQARTRAFSNVIKNKVGGNLVQQF